MSRSGLFWDMLADVEVAGFLFMRGYLANGSMDGNSQSASAESDTWHVGVRGQAFRGMEPSFDDFRATVSG